MRTVVACLALVWLAVALQVSAAESIGAVTLLEGGAALLRGPARYAAAEGVRLEQGDILELGEKALGQLEFADGTVVVLGPQTRFFAMSFPGRGAKHSGDGELFLLSGWMKVLGAQQPSRVIGRCASPPVELSFGDATAVLHVAGSDAAVFAESGEVRVAQASESGRVGDAIRLKPLQFFSGKAGQRAAVSDRPSRAFLTGIPRAFMDTPYARAARFKERSVAPRSSGEFTYAEVQDWINSVPMVRRALASQWQSKLSDPVFRRAIAADLRNHPEWDRLLNPAKYEPARTEAGESERAAERKHAEPRQPSTQERSTGAGEGK